jgi:hypothetical protein
MALSQPSLFLYGFEIVNGNAYIDFLNASMGTQLTAVIPLGDYACTDLLTAIEAAFTVADPANTYTATINRNIAGGTQNRVTISSSGAFFTLLFGSGTHSGASPSTLLGFSASDLTGATSYTGGVSAGTVFITLYPAFNYVAPTRNKKTQGAVNISANGTKEAITFSQSQFFEAEFRYEPFSSVDNNWQPLFDWMTFQKPFEFTPQYPTYGTYYSCTLETTEQASDGLAYLLPEMLPEFPGIFRTGKLTFRVAPIGEAFID